MRIIDTSKPRPTDTLGQLALYSGMDNLTLFEIHSGLSALMDSNRWATYRFEMELQSALISMSLNGIPVDEGARREMVQVFTKQSTHLSELLHEMLEAIGYYDYYINMARHRFSQHVSLDFFLLPSSWDEWLALPLSTRRTLKQEAADELVLFQKSLKEFTTPFNSNSPTQKLRLFYHFFGSPDNLTAQSYFFPPPWLKTLGLKEYKSRNTKGEYTPAADREALEKIIKAGRDNNLRSAAFWASPFAHVCLEIADLTKTLGFLNCKMENGLFRSSYGVVTETGRLASRQNAQGFGCFPPGAEALTKTGWKRLENIQSGELVMQADAFGTLSWAPAEPYKTHFTGNLHCVRTEQTAFTVTPTHRLLMQNHTGPNKGEPYVCQAQKLFEYSSARRVTTASNYSGTVEYPLLLVALFADGSNEGSGTYWRIGFKKERKIKRFLQLVEEAGLTYNEVSAAPGYRRFSLHAPSHWPKDWGCWILNLSLDNARMLLTELCFWDGVARGKSNVFFTARKERAEWVQTLAHITGQSSTIVEKEQSAASWSDTLMYHVNVRPRDFAVIEPKHKSYFEYDGPVYCLTVPSSYFLVRQHSKVFVTGNSNAQNVTPKLRHIFIAPPGEKFIAIDYGQIESRVVAAICFRLFGLENYIAGTESGDLHSLAASMVWDNLPWPKDFTIEWTKRHGPFPKDMIKAAKKLASEPFYRGKSRRDVSKTLGHGTSYLGKPAQMSRMSHIDVKLIEHYQDVFFSVFPEMRQWHQWVVTQVQTKGEITTMLGRTRRFFGRPNDDATIREAVAYEPQSVAADYCNRALLRLHKLHLQGEFPATVRLSKHDELAVTCEESLEEQVLSTMISTMEEHITLTSPTGATRDWFVPAEAESGWNLGRKTEANPDGLSHPLDGRSRSPDRGWGAWRF